MATLDWQLRRTDEVTLVELSVQGDHTQQVTIESRLQPVWPPREQGVPAQGWQENSFEGTVGPDEPLVVGYATPAPPREPPAEITAAGRCDGSAVTPRRLVRALGDSRPPRDVLPATPRESATEPARTTAVDGGTDQERIECVATATQREDDNAHATAATATEPTAWFEAVEGRLAETARLAEATDADEIREAVEAAGGIEAVRELQAQLDEDRRQLRELQRRSETVAEELAAVDLPLATLERVV